MSTEKIKRIRIRDVSLSDPIEEYFDLIGRPLFFSEKDAGIYYGLLIECRRLLAPIDFMGALRTKELAEKLYDEQRLKHNQVALVQSALVQSLASLLGPKYSENIEDALETANDFFRGNLTQKRAAEKILNELGITPMQIEANAMFIRSSGLHMMERMVANREASRNTIIKDHERRLKKAQKDLRKKAQSDSEL